MMRRNWTSIIIPILLLFGALWSFAVRAQECLTPPEYVGLTRAFVESGTQAILEMVDSGVGLQQRGPGTNLEGMLSERQRLMGGIAVSVAFRQDNFRDEAGIAAPLRADRFWCIIAPFDNVLLSDGLTHHYTNVFAVDRQAGTIMFADAWPEKFFLLPDKNEKDVQAQIITHGSGKRLVSITREELRNVIVGIATFYRPTLLDYYTRLQPEAVDDPNAYLPLISSLLQVPIEANLIEAVSVLTRFIESQPQVDHKSVPRATRRLEEIYLLLAFGVPGSSKIMPQADYIELARALRHRFGAQKVMADLDFDAISFYTRAAIKAKAFADAEEFTDILINRFPSALDARVIRADLRYRNGSYRGVVDDASVAIKRHAEAIVALDKLDIQPSEHQIRQLLLYQGVSLSIYLRAKANFKLRDLDKVILDAEKLGQFSMPISNIFFALVFLQKGSLDEARYCLRPDAPLASNSLWVSKARKLLKRPDTAVPIEKVVELLTAYVEIEHPGVALVE